LTDEIVMAHVETLPALSTLVDTVRSEHEMAVAQSQSALQHAIRAGEALLNAREQVGLAQWAEWLADNFSFAPTTAQRYVRLAVYQSEVLAAEAGSISEGLEAIRGLPPTADANDLRRAPEETVAEARALSEAGHGPAHIAAQLGVNRNTVQRWTNPESQQKSNDRYARSRERQRTDKLNQRATILVPPEIPLPDDQVARHRREGMADAAVLLVANRVIPTMHLSDWGDTLGLNHQELTAAVERFKARAARSN
jgi:Protein of unknown function (DUF3102)